jgi:peroxiredoxin family protein/TusA-related sulfurtransferase
MDDITAAQNDPGAAAQGKAAQGAASEVAATGIPATEPELSIDCSGLSCPGPIMAVFQAISAATPGQVLRVSASDPGFRRDIGAWCARTGNVLLSLDSEGRLIIARIRKGGATMTETNTKPVGPTTDNQDKTIVVFSGDLDKALASFVIANGAAAMGRKVTMFFTFWGLNVLRRPEGAHVKKGLIDRMFGVMLPRGTGKLQLSKLRMGGLGTVMMRRVMEQKNIASLEAMVAVAKRSGIHLVACQMSMDMMGIQAAELIDGVEIGGVATYLAAAEQGNVNLFI